MIALTYSVSSFDGLVSSKRKLHLPPNSDAKPKSRHMALAWPISKYPLGSGGNRVCRRPSCLPLLISSIMMFRIKFDGPSSFVRESGEVSVDSVSKDTFLVSPYRALLKRSVSVYKRYWSGSSRG